MPAAPSRSEDGRRKARDARAEFGRRLVQHHPLLPNVKDLVQRRLAAVMAADVVGYSRLMGQDEAGTLVALKARRKDVLEPIVARHRGRIFKVMGDGMFVEFGSAVNAVQCAVELQHVMAAANPTCLKIDASFCASVSIWATS